MEGVGGDRRKEGIITYRILTFRFMGRSIPTIIQYENIWFGEFLGNGMKELFLGTSHGRFSIQNEDKNIGI